MLYFFHFCSLSFSLHETIYQSLPLMSSPFDALFRPSNWDYIVIWDFFPIPFIFSLEYFDTSKVYQMCQCI